jgi:hypothetical protein
MDLFCLSASRVITSVVHIGGGRGGRVFSAPATRLVHKRHGYKNKSGSPAGRKRQSTGHAMEQSSQAQAKEKAEAAGGEGKRELPRAHSGEAAAQAKQQGVGHRGGEWEGVVLEREAAMAEQQMLAAAAEGRPRPLPHLVPQPEDVYDQRLERL